VLRNVGHLTNGAYYLVPLAALVLLQIAHNRFDANEAGSPRRWLFALGVCVLVPLQMPYNGVFFALLCPIAVTLAMASRPGWRTVLVAASLLVAVAASFAIEQIPGLVHQASVGKNSLVADRSPKEAEMYSMRLDQVVLPAEFHRLESLADMKTRFDDEVDVPEGEFRNQYIGAFGVFGLLTLLWALVRAAFPGERRASEATDTTEMYVRMAAILALAAILLAISSGFGVIIAFAVTSKVRTYNRILPFLAFFCLLGAGWTLQCLLERLRGNVVRATVLCAIGVLVIFDTLVDLPQGDRIRAVANFDAAGAYFAEVERRLGNDATVLQLPVAWYPEHPPINRMTDYEEFKPFLMTRTLRFSYGVAHGRLGYIANLALQNMPARERIHQAHQLGFDAILIDSRGYSDDAARAAITDSLTKELPQAPSVSADRRWWTFSLSDCCGSPVVHRAEGDVPTISDYEASAPRFDFSTVGTGWRFSRGGWFEPEPWGTWTSGTGARLRMPLPERASGPLTLSLDTRALVGPKVPKRKLLIEANGQIVGEAVYSQELPAQIVRIEVPEALIAMDRILDLHFSVSPEASPLSAGVSVDGRSLGIGLSSLTIESSAASIPAH
jgi:phosphoglycerol transferase